MSNPRTGSLSRRNGSWRARVTITDPVTGKRRDIRKKAGSKAEAAELRDELVKEVSRRGVKAQTAPVQTVAELCDFWLEKYGQPPRYVDGRKVSGYRSWKNFPAHAHHVKSVIGAVPIRHLTYEDCRRLRLAMFDIPVTQKGSESSRQRSIASVNRTMGFLRRILKIAKRQGWITAHPFDAGDPLITPADERHRQRILSSEEEKALLAVCSAEFAQFVICAIDTGARQSEIVKLAPADVDLERNAIRIREFHTKTLQERWVPMPARLRRIVVDVMKNHPDRATLFGRTRFPRTAWRTARRRAGLDGLRYHDLRHTFATRCTQGGVNLQEVGGVLGHRDPRTTLRYVNVDDRTLERAASAIDKFNAEPPVEAKPEPEPEPEPMEDATVN